MPIFFLQPWLFNGLVRLEFLIVFFALLKLAFSERLVLRTMHAYFGFFLLIISLFITISHGEFDSSFFKLALKLYIIFIGAYFIVSSLSINLNSLKLSLRAVSLLCLVFFLLSALFPPFKEIALALKGETYGLENKLEFYRLWFPTSAHTFHLGVFFICICSIQMVLNEKIKWILMTIFCSAIAARSSLIVCCILLWINLLAKDRRNVFFILLIMPFLIILFNYLVENYTEAKYALEPILNIIDNGTLESKSTDKFFEKHFFLPDTKQILFGDGLYTNTDGTFYMGTDSGYIRPILYGGMFFLIIYVFCMMIITYPLLSYGLIGQLTVCVFFILNLKAEFFTAGPHFALLSIFYWVCYFKRVEIEND